MKVTTRDLGLAAYMQMKGASLISAATATNGWGFETSKSEDDWRLDYYNSESHRHDQAVVALKRFVIR